MIYRSIWLSLDPLRAPRAMATWKKKCCVHTHSKNVYHLRLTYNNEECQWKNKLNQQMLQNLPCAGKTQLNEKTRKRWKHKKMYTGWLEGRSVQNKDNNCLGDYWYRHKRLKVGGSGQIHGLPNCIVILDTVQKRFESKKMMVKRLTWNENLYLRMVEKSTSPLCMTMC